MPEVATFPLAIIAILVALTVDEWAHAFIAWKLGDDTARWARRMTLNPLAHLDAVGAILFLLVGFGWAKPVPVDSRNFRHPVRDNALVAVAGPASNVVVAFIAAVGIVLLGMAPSMQGVAWMMLRSILELSVRFNLALFAFNLLPIPPLDGSNIIRALLPWRMRERYEDLAQYGMWILLGVILAESVFNIPLISGWVNVIVRMTIALFAVILPF